MAANWGAGGSQTYFLAAAPQELFAACNKTNRQHPAPDFDATAPYGMPTPAPYPRHQIYRISATRVG